MVQFEGKIGTLYQISTDFEILGPSPKIRRRKKNLHSVNLDFSGLKRLSSVVHPMSYVG